MYRYVPYQEIEKNKWNGTVHYSPNGNIFGHYWYLKSVYKEWDAIVEDEYVSVIPILPKSKVDLTHLTPELGPYSVNPMTLDRSNTLIRLMKERTLGEYYPINNSVQNINSFNSELDHQYNQQDLHLIDTYEALKDAYNDNGLSLIDSIKTEEVTFVSSIKPETILAQSSRHNKAEKDALIRTMYNALHRGIGWSQGITEKKSGKYLALSFYVVSHNVIHEIFHIDHTAPKYRLLMYDVFLRSSAGKPSLLKMYHSDSITESLGFTTFSKRIHKIKEAPKAWWKRLISY